MDYDLENLKESYGIEQDKKYIIFDVSLLNVKNG